MLEAKGIRKTYGGVVALAGADLMVRAGSAHALLGENGAGKSTLVKVFAGVVSPDRGELLLDGDPVSFQSSAEAVRHGVSVVSQELNLFEDLDVLANLYPMRELRRGPFVSRSAMARQALPVLEELGLEVSPRASVGSLTLAQRQLVEIAKALLTEPRVIVLDEPTSALEAASSETLLGILRVLRERQVAVVFVSHILEEAMALCDEFTVLRDGRVVLQAAPRAEIDVPRLVEAMLGQPLAQRRETDVGVERLRERVAGALEVQERGETRSESQLHLRDVGMGRWLHDVSLSAAPGEIVGLAGVEGAGQLGVLELIAGLRRPAAGTVTLPGGNSAARSLRGAIGSGVAFVSGDRRRLGLMLDKPIWENIAQVRAIGMGADGILVRTARLREHAREHALRLEIKAASVDVRAGLLSGGNQQKVVFAKWLDANPSLILLDDPTRGVDVGAKAEMHALIRSAADAGAIVLVCSTDVDELAELCDRVLVFRHGGVSAELAGDDLGEHALLAAMNTGAAPAL